MGYIFKEKITYEQYDEFIKKQPRFSYMQEDKWSDVISNKNHMIVAVLNNKEVCVLAHILIYKKTFGYQFFIPNGFVLDYTNKKLLEFMTENIKKLAIKKKVYTIDIYPNISKNDLIYSEIHKNLISLGYTYKNEYINNTKNVLISLQNKNKKINKAELKRKYENKDFYLKRGIFFEKSNNEKDISRLEYLITENYFDSTILKKLLNNFKNRITILFAKLDLVFYKNFLIENNITDELNKIEELLEISDEIDIGCAILIEPYNSINSICEYIYNTEKESFTHLRISNGLMYEAIKICLEKKYVSINISNLKLNVKYYTDNFNGQQYAYAGHYNIKLNKFIYFLNKEIGLIKNNY